MIGVCAVWRRLRIIAAVSKPSMPGMFTSSRMTAKSRSSRTRSASRPERAVITFWPKPSRMVSYTRSFSGRSSTTRMSTFSSLAMRVDRFQRRIEAPAVLQRK